MSEETFRKLWSKHQKKMPHLETVGKNLRTYTDQVVPVVGSIDVEVRCKEVSKVLPLWVVKGSGPALLGRDWLPLTGLDLNNIRNCGETDTHNYASVLEKSTSQFLKKALVFSAGVK